MSNKLNNDYTNNVFIKRIFPYTCSNAFYNCVINRRGEFLNILEGIERSLDVKQSGYLIPQFRSSSCECSVTKCKYSQTCFSDHLSTKTTFFPPLKMVSHCNMY